MDVLNVMYFENCSTLLITDSDENAVEFDVNPDSMMNLARNLFCARDKVTDYTVNKECTLRYAKEIVEHLTAYIKSQDKKGADK